MTEIPTFPLSLFHPPDNRAPPTVLAIYFAAFTAAAPPSLVSFTNGTTATRPPAGEWALGDVGMARGKEAASAGGGGGRHLLSTLFPRDRQSRPWTKEVNRRKQYLARQYIWVLRLEWASITDWKKRKGVTLKIAFPHFVNINISLFTFHFISTTGSFIFNSLTLVDESAVFAPPQAVTSGCVRGPPCTCSSLSFRLLRGSSDGASVFAAPRCSFVRKSM